MKNKMPRKYLIIGVILILPEEIVSLGSLLTPYDSNGFSIKLYGVKNEIVIIISQDNDEVTRIILYFIGILFFIVNHHCIKL